MAEEREREIILDALSRRWARNPELRLGQIIANEARNWNSSADPFYMPDVSLLEQLEARDA